MDPPGVHEISGQGQGLERANAEEPMSMLEQVNIKPDPDFNEFLKILQGEESDRLRFYDFFADKPIKDRIVGKPTLFSFLLPLGSESMETLIKNDIEFWYSLGYDYMPTAPLSGGFFNPEVVEDTAGLSKGPRWWLTEKSMRRVTNREEFEAFEWPSIDRIDFSYFDLVPEFLPQGMKVIGQGSGILEGVMWMMSHTGLAYAMADDPELVQMIFDRVGEFSVAFVERMARRDFVGAIQFGDDMGFKTGTLISPRDLRKYAFPWHKKAVEAAKSHGKPFILHSCGNLEKIMDDLIDEVGIDAKHSFEDVIVPVAEVKKRWGERVAILGGIDMDVLVRAAPDTIRKYTREVIESCVPGGGYALGCGNTVANYIPPENFLAMLDEGWKWNQESH